MKFSIILVLTWLSILSAFQVHAVEDNKSGVYEEDLLHLNAEELMGHAIYKAKLGYGEDVNYNVHVVMRGASEKQYQLAVTSAVALINSQNRSTQFYKGIDDDANPSTATAIVISGYGYQNSISTQDYENLELFQQALYSSLMKAHYELWEIETGRIGGVKIVSPKETPITNFTRKKTKCDQLVASPWDKNRLSKGVDKILDLKLAVSACAVDIKKHPNEATSQFQYARALFYSKDFQNAKNYIELATAQKYPIAIFLQGHMHYFGWGYKQDRNLGCQYYRAAAQQKFSVAMLYIGSCHAKGEYGPVHRYTARQWYSLAMDADLPEAFYAMAIYELNGNPDFSTRRNKDKAAFFFKQAALGGVIKAKEKFAELKAQNFTGYKYSQVFNKQQLAKQQKQDASFAALKKKAQGGNVEAQFKMGQLYLVGEKIPANRSQANYWFLHAARQGHPESLLLAGKWYSGTENIRERRIEAEQWLEQSGALGNSEAYYELGNLYQRSRGYRSGNNRQISESYFNKAAKLGHVASTSIVAQLNDKRLKASFKTDPVKAAKWYEKAAQNQDLEAMYEIGGRYISGDGVQADLNKGLVWIIEAANNGLVEANDHLCYMQMMPSVRTKVEQNLVVKYCTKAIAADSMYSQYSYATMLDKGYASMKPNAVKALSLMTKSAENGYEPAQLTLMSWYQLGHIVPKDEKKAQFWANKAYDEVTGSRSTAYIGILCELEDARRLCRVINSEQRDKAQTNVGHLEKTWTQENIDLLVTNFGLQQHKQDMMERSPAQYQVTKKSTNPFDFENMFENEGLVKILKSLIK